MERHLPISERAKANIKTIADAVGQIIWIWKTTETQLDGTRKAFGDLKESYDDSVNSPVDRRWCSLRARTVLIPT